MATHDRREAYLIRDVHVISGDGREIEGADVLIRDGVVHEISEHRLDGRDATVVDGRGKSLIPGLIDTHVHLDFLAVRGVLRSWWQTRRVLPRALGEVVRAGVTTVRCMADPVVPVVRLRRRVEKGRFASPGIVTAGPALTAPGGHPAATLAKDNRWLRKRIARAVSDPARARSVVREVHAAGADLVKLVYQGGRYGPERVSLGKLTREVAQAIVEEARRLGLPVSAHTHYEDDVAFLLELGVDSIEHGVIEHDLSDSHTLRAWASAGTRLVPTLTIAALFAGPEGELYIDTAHRNLTRAHEAGVRIVAGTDSMVGAMPANAMHDELRRMVAAGMSETAAIRAATADAADLLGLADRGVIEPGRRADLVLLRSNPLEQIENLADVDRVFRGGAVVHDAPTPPAPPELGTYAASGPPVLEFRDLTGGTVPGDAVVRYDRSRFTEDGIRTVSYLDPRTGEPLRTDTVRSGPDLITQEWWCEIPAERTSLHAATQGVGITLTGSLEGKPVTRNYPLRGQTWMQLLLFDPATFITSAEESLSVVSIGASGRGALQLTDFEVTRKGATDDGSTVEAELVMPRWRRFWGAITQFDARTGDPRRQHIRGKKDETLERREHVPRPG